MEDERFILNRSFQEQFKKITSKPEYEKLVLKNCQKIKLTKEFLNEIKLSQLKNVNC